MFFAIRPELQSHHGLAEETIAHVADLSAALAGRGTTLVFLPVPTRAQVMSHMLPPFAADLGYDASVATAVHVDTVARLERAGVVVADPLVALRAAALAGERPFFEADPRPTATGARILADTVAGALSDHASLTDARTASFTSVPAGTQTLASAMRSGLQSACLSELPAVSTDAFTTNAGQFGANTDTQIVVGTEITETSALNLPGFLSEATGLRTLGYGVPGGGAFAAISTYLTSQDFQTAPPKVLVWEVPVSAPLGQFGDQPIRELTAAAGATCSAPVPVRAADASGALTAELSSAQLTERTALSFNTGGTGVAAVRFDFVGADGFARSRSIYRHDGQVLTGQFFVPVGGLADYGVTSVRISGSSAFGTAPQLNVCF